MRSVQARGARLNSAARKFEGGVHFVGIDIQDTESAAPAYQAAIWLPYPVGPATRVATAIGA